MKLKAISHIAQQLREVANHTTKLGPGVHGLSSNFQIHDNVAYRLTIDASISFNEVVRKILKEKDFAEKLSAKYVDKKLKSLFAQLLSNESLDLEKELELLIDEFNAFKQNSAVFLKIEGVILSASFELGRVLFLPGDQHLVSNMQDKASTIIKSAKNDQETKEFLIQLTSQTVKDEFAGGCVGVVEVNAEPIRAFEVAKEEVRRAIDLLRFTSKAIYPLKEDIRIGLKGDHPKSDRTGFIFSEFGLNTKGDSIGSYLPFTITQETLESMRKIGVFAISSALCKKQANDFEESLIRSIHWFSVALTQVENSNAFLFLIVALETLFKTEQGNSISGSVAVSVAFLMSDNLEGRKKLVFLIRDYYKKRSNVAHGGKKTISDADLYTLIKIAGTSIMVAIEKLSEFNSQKQFMSWIEDQKLS